MFKTIANAFKIKEIRNKILLTLLLLLIYTKIYLLFAFHK